MPNVGGCYIADADGSNKRRVEGPEEIPVPPEAPAAEEPVFEDEIMEESGDAVSEEDSAGED